MYLVMVVEQRPEPHTCSVVLRTERRGFPVRVPSRSCPGGPSDCVAAPCPPTPHGKAGPGCMEAPVQAWREGPLLCARPAPVGCSGPAPSLGALPTAPHSGVLPVRLAG